MISSSTKWTLFLTLAVLLARSTYGSESMSGLGSAEGKIVGRNAALEADPSQEQYSIIAGPYADAPGIVAKVDPFDVRAKLVRVVSGQGTFGFWFRGAQTYQSGSLTTDVNAKICSLDGLAVVSMEVRSSAVALVIKWTGLQRPPEEIRILVPEIPGDCWHHFAVVWDDSRRYVNAYLNGEPYYFDGLGVAGGAHGEATAIIAHVGQIALADITIDAAAATAEDIHIMTKKGDRDLPSLLSTIKPSSPSVDFQPVRPLYYAEMAFPDQTNDWIMEGAGIVSRSEGWTEIRSERPNGPEGHIVYWCPIEFPSSFRAEWDFEILQEKGLCIVFFAAAGRNGHDLFDPSMSKRTGRFDEYIYGDIDAYHISYFANTPDEPRALANLRKNRGFFLLSNGPVGVTKGRKGVVHHAVLIKKAGHILMKVDGRTIIDYMDDGTRAGPILQKGRIGFRQMQWTSARYRHFAVYPLEEALSP